MMAAVCGTVFAVRMPLGLFRGSSYRQSSFSGFFAWLRGNDELQLNTVNISEWTHYSVIIEHFQQVYSMLPSPNDC